MNKLILFTIARRGSSLSLRESSEAQTLLPSSFHRAFSLSSPTESLKSFDKRKLKGRKPRSLGRAPTKLEVVDPDPTLDPEEEKLKADWEKQYLVDMEQAVGLMREKTRLDSLDTGVEKRWIYEEHKHHERMMQINDMWNKEVGEIRELEMKEKRKENERRISVEAGLALAARKGERDRAFAHARRLEMEAPEFVTLDNLEAKVEEALEAQLIEYNFALDKLGRILEEDVAK